MNNEVIVGICRFSFLGLGDWTVYRENRDASPTRLKEIARYLYSDSRMTARFMTFENICLPSILAQQDPSFIFIVLSSPDMPEKWRNRLIKLCEPHDQIALLWSEISDTNEAIRESLKELHDLSDGHLWQFRLDDDDAIDVHYIARLREHISRLKTLKTCAITIARGISLALYEGQETQFLEFKMPFHAAGPCVKLAHSGNSIFRFGHLAIRNRLSNFVDYDNIGAFCLKWRSDCRPLKLDQLPPSFHKISRNEYERRLHRGFPFLQDFDFETLRSVSLEIPHRETIGVMTEPIE